MTQTKTLIRQKLYTKRTVGGTSIYPVWKEIIYQSDEGNGYVLFNVNLSNSYLGSEPAVTEYTYQWYHDSLQMYMRTTTLPSVSADQNGSDTADTRVEIFDDCCGHVVWVKDERGVITHYVYDGVTGALVQRVDDSTGGEGQVSWFNVSGQPPEVVVTDPLPEPWPTPSGGGLCLLTDYTIDLRGRVTQELGPAHAVDLNGTATTIRRARWTVYRDEIDERWEGVGYVAGTAPNEVFTLINPVKITRKDSEGRVTDEILAVRQGSGKLTASDQLPQSSWVRWNKTHYDYQNMVMYQRVYFLIPESGEGSLGVNYNQTDYGYDAIRRRNRVRTPGGTITRTVYHPCDWPLEIWVGTDDTGASDGDPSAGGGNDMIKVQSNVYDGGVVGGDGNLTQQTLIENATTERVTTFGYDFRNRRVWTDGEIAFYETRNYDNLDRVIRVSRRNESSGGDLIACTETKYDNRGRVYQTTRYGLAVSSSSSSSSSSGQPPSLIDNVWYDASGNVIKQQNAGSRAFQKMVYDSVGRVAKRYMTHDVDEDSYADAGDVADDVVMQQMEFAYDDASNQIGQVTRDRFHDATGTGELTDPNGAQPKARVSYAALWPDPIGRQVAAASYGTNGAQAWTRPATIPESSDLVLVSRTEYNDRGEVISTTDAKGIVTKQEYDDAGRLTQKIENYVEE